MRTARSYEARTSIQGRGGPTTACRRSSTRSRCRRPPPATSGTSSSAYGWSTTQLSEPGRSSVTRSASGTDQGQDPVHLGRRQQHRRQRRRWCPLRPLGGRGQHLLRGAGQEPLAQALAVTLPDPTAGVELVVVAGHAGGGELVDVAEQQLGELGHGGGRESGLGGVPGQPAPAHPGTDPVGRQQRIHRPSGPRLAAAQGVGTLQRRAPRRAGVDVTGAARQLEEAADGHLHGRLDALAHRAAKADPIARHVCHHGGDRLRRDGGQTVPQGPQHAVVDAEGVRTCRRISET